MKWYSTRIDKLPKDKQEVLLSVEGVNHVAIYDANRKVFTVEGNQRKKTYKSDLVQLYWTEYTKPGESK
jgi:hypothetical protein